MVLCTIDFQISFIWKLSWKKIKHLFSSDMAYVISDYIGRLKIT